MLIAIISYCFVMVVLSYWGTLKELILHHYFSLSIFTLCIVSVPIFPVLRRWYAGPSGFGNLTLVTVSFAIPVYYLSLLTFSWSLFMYLPASRGGGDYTAGSQVILKLNKDYVRDVMTDPFLEVVHPPVSRAAANEDKEGTHANAKADDAPQGLLTRQCVLIEETASAFYLALPDDAGGPGAWRQSTFDRPKVLALARSSVVAVQYLASH